MFFGKLFLMNNVLLNRGVEYVKLKIVIYYYNGEVIRGFFQIKWVDDKEVLFMRVLSSVFLDENVNIKEVENCKGSGKDVGSLG